MNSIADMLKHCFIGDGHHLALPLKLSYLKYIFVSVNDCRLKWKKIKKNHFNILRKKGKRHHVTLKEYCNGRLSFLDKYFNDEIKSLSQGDPDILVIESEKDSNVNDFFTIDLDVIEGLLASRNDLEDIPSIYEELSVVFKRIDEQLLSFTKPTQSTARVNSMNTIGLPSSWFKNQDDPKLASEPQPSLESCYMHLDDPISIQYQ